MINTARGATLQTSYPHDYNDDYSENVVPAAPVAVHTSKHSTEWRAAIHPPFSIGVNSTHEFTIFDDTNKDNQYC